MSGLSKKYRVNYNDDIQWFTDAKEAYNAGEEVTFYFNMVATDTNYYFYLDEEQIYPSYETDKGYKISFTMPEHDVSVRVDAINSMRYMPENRKETVLKFHSFEGGGPSYNVKLNREGIADIKQTRHYYNPEHEYMCGSGYDVNISFIGIKPGKAEATIECRSPIADNFDAVYDITVFEDLSVSVTERKRTEL